VHVGTGQRCLAAHYTNLTGRFPSSGDNASLSALMAMQFV
jgi:hypothetical protein